MRSYGSTWGVFSSPAGILADCWDCWKCKIICQEAKVQKKPYIRVLRPADLKFRPIVAGPRCPTSRLSNFVDILIEPFTLHVQSYLRDTIDFLNYLPKTVPESTILVSFDVTSLYTNINHELGIKAMKYWINKHPGSLNSSFSKENRLVCIECSISLDRAEINDLVEKLKQD